MYIYEACTENKYSIFVGFKKNVLKKKKLHGYINIFVSYFST